MVGILVTAPTLVYRDNHLVLCNTTIPGSTPKKKSNIIAFHFVQEGCAFNKWRTTYINTHFNVADLMTKPLYGEKRWLFVQMLQHYISPCFGEAGVILKLIQR